MDVQTDFLVRVMISPLLINYLLVIYYLHKYNSTAITLLVLFIYEMTSAKDVVKQRGKHVRGGVGARYSLLQGRQTILFIIRLADVSISN